MPENDNAPAIESEILELLDGEMQDAALDFAAYLTANEMTPSAWFGPTHWRIPYGEHFLCGIKLDQGRWRFWFFTGDYGGEMDAALTKVVQDHVGRCVSCVDDCPKGKPMAVFGEEYADACCQFPIQIENPDENTLAVVKALIEYWKGAAPRSDSWHCR